MPLLKRLLIPALLLPGALMAQPYLPPADSAYLRGLYEHLHRNPELSFQEKETSRRMAQELEKLGFEVASGIGGYGVVGVLRNGDGPTVMVRTDTDALPLQEDTGLPYASQAKGLSDDGQPVPAMHACGHDMHMTVWVGAARKLAAAKSQWKGTLVFIAQPAEERGGGAKNMLAEGLFEKFPKPDYCLALHCSATLPAGSIGYKPGYALASVDMVDITVYGKGGHGAYPHTTVDPVVLASRMVLDFQTIVSREIAPTEPAVVTVGSIHGGTKHNIIPSEVKLQLTLRSYSDQVRQHSLQALSRIANGLAKSAGLPDELMPKIVVADESIPSTYNTPELVERLLPALRQAIGDDQVVPVQAVMGGEDFGMYGKTDDQVPVFIYWLGTIAPERVAAANAGGEALPSLHSPFFAPVPDASIRTGVATMAQAVMSLLQP
jgi:hippurate hydrolase